MFLFKVKSSQEPGWLEGTLNGKTGLIPENYVEVLPWQSGSFSKISHTIRQGISKAFHIRHDPLIDVSLSRLKLHRQSIDSVRRTLTRQSSTERKSST